MKDHSEVSRFWKRVDKGMSCWKWVGPKINGGYGTFKAPKDGAWKSVTAHRYSWELHNGPITNGLWVLHKCDNPPCVNPEHLFLGTRSDNMKDCVQKNRHDPPGRSRMTHCFKGHKFTDITTKISTSKAGRIHRRCRICWYENRAERYAYNQMLKLKSGLNESELKIVDELARRMRDGSAKTHFDFAMIAHEYFKNKDLGKD